MGGADLPIHAFPLSAAVRVVSLQACGTPGSAERCIEVGWLVAAQCLCLPCPHNHLPRLGACVCVGVCVRPQRTSMHSPMPPPFNAYQRGCRDGAVVSLRHLAAFVRPAPCHAFHPLSDLGCWVRRGQRAVAEQQLAHGQLYVLLVLLRVNCLTPEFLDAGALAKRGFGDGLRSTAGRGDWRGGGGQHAVGSSACLANFRRCCVCGAMTHTFDHAFGIMHASPG